LLPLSLPGYHIFLPNARLLDVEKRGVEQRYFCEICTSYSSFQRNTQFMPKNIQIIDKSWLRITKMRGMVIVLMRVRRVPSFQKLSGIHQFPPPIEIWSWDSIIIKMRESPTLIDKNVTRNTSHESPQGS
jgi:hypothetical protein